MSRSSQEVPPHLIAYYKILDLPVGSPFKDVQSRYHQLNARLRRSCGRHNGEAAYKFIPKLDKAFQSLKQAHFQPNSARQAPPHPLQPVQNAPYHQPSGYSPIEQTPQDPHASGNQSSGAVSDTPRISQHPPLNPVPKYTPQSRFMHQPRHGMAPGFSIKHIQSNIFDAAEDRAVIVHAVNCQGVWGMGVALQIKKALPTAFKVYNERCRAAGSGLIGTCFLIPPQTADYQVKDGTKVVYSHRRWVACLFTSTGYGKKNDARNNPGKDSVADIQVHTKTALRDLRMQLEAFGPSNYSIDASWNTDDEKPGKVLAVKFNSGAFGVPWESTQALIREVFTGFERPFHIFDGNVAPAKKLSKLDEGKPRLATDEPDGN